MGFSNIGNNVGVLEALSGSGNVTLQGNLVAVPSQSDLGINGSSALAGGTSGPYGLASGSSGTFTRSLTEYTDANNDGDYDAGIDIIGRTLTLVLNLQALQFTGAPVVTTGGAVCAGQMPTLSFNANDCLKAGNTFTVYLSDASGNFPGGGTSLGTVSPGVSNPITIPAGTPTGSSYKVRIVSGNAPALTSPESNTFAVTGLASNFNSNPTVSQTPACAGATVKVSFTVKPNPACAFPAGNVFTVELSDASGSFAAPVNLGPVSPGINNVTIPESTPTGSGYRIRIVATAGGSSAYSAPSAAFTVNQPSFAAAPTVNLDNKCAGEAVRLSFTTRCTFFAGNTFTAYLSDASGNFPGGGTSLGTVTPGAMNNVVIPAGTPAGTGYKIRVVSSNPMVTSPASANVKVKACNNTREAAPEENGLQVRVSPNPSPEGRLRIHVSGAEGQALKVALFSGTGQPVREQAIGRSSETEVLEWDITRQPAGLYLLRVSGAKESKTVKVLH